MLIRLGNALPDGRASASLALLAACLLLPTMFNLYVNKASEPQQETRLDLLIKRGKVVDGAGSEPVIADVGIKGDRIVFIGAAGPETAAARALDATGLVVAPGFIDPHTHT